MTVRFRLASGLVAALLLAGCSGDPGQGELPEAQPTADPSAIQVEAPADGIDYVALGDSFSSGPLIPLQRNDASGCFRSTNNYPAYVAQLLGVQTYRDATCAGAVTADLTQSQQVFLGDTLPPPQLDRLSKDTDLVTLGIGGNDFELFGSIIGGCSRLANWKDPGDPCRTSFDADGVDQKAQDAERIQKRVSRSLAKVDKRAPNAAVYVVGYPELMPRDGSCRVAGLTDGDARWAADIGIVLNQSLRKAAVVNDATYVDLARPSRGHDVCEGTAAWINGKKNVQDVALSFHPLQSGMAAMAQVVAGAISGEEQPLPQGDAEPPEGSIIRGTD